MTGVQPYVILLDYDAELTTDAQKEDYTIDYYDKNIEIDNAFLYIYFAEEDTDNDVGYMCYAVGTEASAVMDDEAVEIFWDYIDRYWYTNLSTDEMFEQVFTDTADTIMPATALNAGVLRTVVVVLAVIAVLAVAYFMIRRRNRRGSDPGGDVIDTGSSDYY